AGVGSVAVGGVHDVARDLTAVEGVRTSGGYALERRREGGILEPLPGGERRSVGVMEVRPRPVLAPVAFRSPRRAQSAGEDQALLGGAGSRAGKGSPRQAFRDADAPV